MEKTAGSLLTLGKPRLPLTDLPVTSALDTPSRTPPRDGGCVQYTPCTAKSLGLPTPTGAPAARPQLQPEATSHTPPPTTPPTAPTTRKPPHTPDNSIGASSVYQPEPMMRLTFFRSHTEDDLGSTWAHDVDEFDPISLPPRGQSSYI